MKQLVAVHVIIRGDEDGKIERIEPGKSFKSEGQEAKDLLERGAARLATKDADVEDSTEDKDDVKLEDMTKKELVAYAEEHGIEVDAKATNAVILATIQAAGSKDEGLI